MADRSNMEVIKSMPLGYTKAEGNAFKHGWFLSRDYTKKELIEAACLWLQEHKDAVETEDNGIAGWIPDYFIEDFKKEMEYII